jgi:hypothetical protein
MVQEDLVVDLTEVVEVVLEEWFVKKFLLQEILL